MKKTAFPLQFIFVGLFPNQQGQAASQEHDSSSSPTIFHGVVGLPFVASARATRDGVPTKSSADARSRFQLVRRMAGSPWFLRGSPPSRKSPSRSRGILRLPRRVFESAL